MLLKKDLERQWIRKYRGVELVSGHNRTSPTRVLQEIGGAWLVLPLSTSLHPTLIWNASTIVECVYGNSIEDRLFAEVFFFSAFLPGTKSPEKFGRNVSISGRKEFLVTYCVSILFFLFPCTVQWFRLPRGFLFFFYRWFFWIFFNIGSR